MVPDDTLASVGDVGPYLVIVVESLLRGVGVKNYLLVRTIGTIDLSGLFDVLPETRAEGRLMCESFDLVRYLIPEVVAGAKRIAR